MFQAQKKTWTICLKSPTAEMGWSWRKIWIAEKYLMLLEFACLGCCCCLLPSFVVLCLLQQPDPSMDLLPWTWNRRDRVAPSLSPLLPALSHTHLFLSLDTLLLCCLVSSPASSFDLKNPAAILWLLHLLLWIATVPALAVTGPKVGTVGDCKREEREEEQQQEE